MAFGEENDSQVSNPEVYVRDYWHASNVFRRNGYENAPRRKFLYHVYFTVNTSEIKPLATIFDNNKLSTVGLLVKNIQLPRYEIETETLNQYNRKRIIQKKINYQPVELEFHDDGGDLIRKLWYQYFSYYYKDPSQQYNNVPPTNGTNGQSQTQSNAFSYNNRDIYDDVRTVNEWGYSGESYSDGTGSSTSTSGKPPFFRDIRIYGLNENKFAEYVLINPLIKSWTHDTYDYSEDGGIMNNRVMIEYETVKYYSGTLGSGRPDPNVVGFADPNYYDGKPGGIFYPGFVSSSRVGLVDDLQAGSLISPVGSSQRALITPSTSAVIAQEQITTFSSQVFRGVTTTTQPVVVPVPAQIRPQPAQQGNQAPFFPTFNPATGGIAGPEDQGISSLPLA
jgi:hypothetical protein